MANYYHLEMDAEEWLAFILLRAYISWQPFCWFVSAKGISVFIVIHIMHENSQKESVRCHTEILIKRDRYV